MQPLQVETGFLELRTTDLSSPTDQISSGGESGFFDATSYTDLQAFFEAEQDHSQTLTPAGTPEENERLEWTYLEPVKPAENLRISNAEVVHFEDIQLMPIPSGPWNVSDSAVVIKTEPMPATHQPPPNVGLCLDYDVAPAQHSGYPSPAAAPVQLTKREQKLYFSNEMSSPAFDNSYATPPARTKKGGKSSDSSGVVRLCHVCGETAGKHSYYGGQVCPSCRAFFRRSVQSK